MKINQSLRNPTRSVYFPNESLDLRVTSFKQIRNVYRELFRIHDNWDWDRINQEAQKLLVQHCPPR
jgi:hypothetical protein